MRECARRYLLDPQYLNDLEVTEDQAAADASRHHLDAYAAFVYGLQPALHHQEWCERIQDVVEDRPLWLNGTTRSRKRKLLLTAPPGHAKSTYTSLILPAYYVGKHPDEHVLFYTSNDTNAGNFDGVVAQTLEANPRHALAFPDEDCRPNYKRGWSSEGRFLNGIPIHAKDPNYRAVGWKSSILGGRAHGYVLDDVLTQEQSESEVEQAAAKKKFEGTVDTRLIPGGWAIGIMTRWHELDLPSYLATLPDWEHVNYPALTGEGASRAPDGLLGQQRESYPWGKALWPERFSEAFLLLRRLSNPELFEAYYQGDPTTLGGSIFKSGYFQPLPADIGDRKGARLSLLERLVKVQMWDLNYSEKQASDYTVGLTLGCDFDTGKLYILRVNRAHLTEHQHEEFLAREIVLSKPAMVGIWKGAYRTKSVEDLVRRISKRLIGKHACTVYALDETTDKVVRARLPAAYGAQGNLYVYKQAPWYPEFLSECLGFPKRAHDDQVDALAGATQLALEYGPIANLPPTSEYAFGPDLKRRAA